MKDKVILCLCVIALMAAIAGCKRTNTDKPTETKDVTPSEIVTSPQTDPETEKITSPVTTPQTDPVSQTPVTNPVTGPVTVPETQHIRQPLVTRDALVTVGYPTPVIPQPQLPETTAPVTKPVTHPVTEPVTVPVTEPVTEPVATEPVTTAPETEPETDENGDIVTSPVTEVPETEPPVTEPVTTDLPVTDPPETEPEPEPVRIQVTKRKNASENLVFHDFYMAGVGCSIVYENNAIVPYGAVISVSFSGKEDNGHYYVDYGTKATLHVSTAKGDNVNLYRDKVVFLTFDDGPSAHSQEVLDILATYNAKATFFTVGSYVARYPTQIRAMYQAGHALGCHSYSHEYEKLYPTNATLVREVYQWEDTIKSILGGMLPYKLFRYPGGDNNSYLDPLTREDCKQDLNSLGYLSFDWTIATNDAYFAGKREDQTMEDYFKESLIATVGSVEKYNPQRIRVLLMHETNGTSRKILPWVLEYLSAKGYVFRTLDQADESWLFR